MSRFDQTLANLASGISFCSDLGGWYPPRKGLALYCLPPAGYSPSSPGMILGEALAARSGLGCTLLEGIPARIPEGAVVVADYAALKVQRPELLADIPEFREPRSYAIRLGRHALITSQSREGLAAGMQTLAMLVLRHTEEKLPGCIIVDTPLCHTRTLGIELQGAEICINLLMQIVSFAATFKANRLNLILDDDFDPAEDIPGIDTFINACKSYGITVGVRVPFLGRILEGKSTLLNTWTAVRAVARTFAASEAALDDPCPPGADPALCGRIVQSVARGEVGLQHFALDARVLYLSGLPAAEIRSSGIVGWYRVWDGDPIPPAEMNALPVMLDVQSAVPGFSARDSVEFHRRLDAAIGWLRGRLRRDFMVSFRHIGVSHMWQNLLVPAATGLICAWGEPKTAREAAMRFSRLLYGESAEDVLAMWDAISQAFPQALGPEEEMVVRKTAFGLWPDSEAAADLLRGIDWMRVTRSIKTAAESLRSAAAGLSRNTATLTGARLSLYALSWLHCFTALTPELDRRRRLKFDEDARTEPIAAELYNNFRAWQKHLQEMGMESGFDFCEAAQVEAMGLRLKGLCEGIFE